MSDGLSPAELLRYSRHLLIPGVGTEGQLRLKNASVLMIGTGGLGCPAALYLSAAGVGRIGLIDPDTVDASNLQRQILHGESWIGKPKLDSASARLREINPHITIDLHPVRFTPDNAIELAENYDILLDGSDNFPTRFLANDTAFFLKKPLIYGAIHRFEGQASIFAPHLGGPCYRCLLPELPAPGSVPSCAEAGVLGVLPGIIGSLQAMEAIKLILNIGKPPLGKLTIYDALNSSFRSITLRRDPSCRLCGDHPSVDSVTNPETLAPAYCEIPDDHMETITTAELRERLAGNFDALLIDVREHDEYAVANIPGAKLIPLGTLNDHLDELPKDREILIHCKSGRRSARAVDLLLANGFTDVKNVEGGIDSWLAEN
ncbi:MAG TPA: molybdopterin-synthase adenylyltransferase MoeB [Luteolibacter sp.]|nr:molybdopterin-synthase adenylyltransferase MoeB [Luteolibacter sp.]